MGYALGSTMTYMLLARLLQAFEWSLPPGETGIDLSEEEKSLFKAKPLLACATPRLSPELLEKLINEKKIAVKLSLGSFKYKLSIN